MIGTKVKTLSHNSPIALYHQLKDLLLEEILSGNQKEGDKIPPEYVLQEQFGISRATVRQALAELEREGYIERKQGVGTIVCRQKIRPRIMELTSFSEDMRARGLKPGSVTLSLNFMLPPQVVRERLKLKPGEKVWLVRRLRLANDEAVGLHSLYIPPTLEFAPRDLENMSSYYTLLSERHGIEPLYADEILSARNATKEEADLLGIQEGSAILTVDRTTYRLEDQPMEFVRIAYRADRYEYDIALYRTISPST